MIKKVIFSALLVAAILFGSFSIAFAADAEVRTDSANKINAFDAVLNGFVDTNDDEDIYVWFEWDTKSSGYRNFTPPKFIRETTGDDFEYKLANLQPDTTYYFRAVGENEDGDVIRGDRKSFRTDDAGSNYYDPYYPPYNYDQYNYGNTVYQNDYYFPSTQVRVSTIPATIPNDSAGSAILNGYVDTQGENVVRWFEFGTIRNFLPESTIHLSHGNASGSFNQFVSGLRPNTTYYFRAVAQGSGNPVYGQVIPFSVRSYVPPPAPVYVPPVAPTYTVPVIPTITIPVRVTPIFETPAPIEVEVPTEVVPVQEEGSVLGAFAIFGDGFFPNTLIGWLFLLLLVVVLVYVAQKAFTEPHRSHGSNNHNSHSHPTSTGHEF